MGRGLVWWLDGRLSFNPANHQRLLARDAITWGFASHPTGDLQVTHQLSVQTIYLHKMHANISFSHGNRGITITMESSRINSMYARDKSLQGSVTTRTRGGDYTSEGWRNIIRELEKYFRGWRNMSEGWRNMLKSWRDMAEGWRSMSEGLEEYVQGVVEYVRGAEEDVREIKCLD